MFCGSLIASSSSVFVDDSMLESCENAPFSLQGQYIVIRGAISSIRLKPVDVQYPDEWPGLLTASINSAFFFFCFLILRFSLPFSDYSWSNKSVIV